MRRTLTRAAIVGALASGLLGAAVVPAQAAGYWVSMGRFQSNSDCSREGAAIVRGPKYSQYECQIDFDKNGGYYTLFVR